jgi:hypothetical protein
VASVSEFNQQEEKGSTAAKPRVLALKRRVGVGEKTGPVEGMGGREAVGGRTLSRP